MATEEAGIPPSGRNNDMGTNSHSHREDANDTINVSGQGASDSPPSKPNKEDIGAQNLTLTTTSISAQKPYSAFSNRTKWGIVTMTAMATFFSPLSGQIYYPVLPILTRTYHLSSGLINVSITTYMIFQGLTPSFMGTFSDASGRRLGYILAFTIYTAANIGLALQDSYAALLVLRCLQSAGSSGTVAFGYGVVADIVTTAERGKFIGPMAAGALTAPALGPTIGGLLTQFLGWRAVFWFLTIISGGYLVAYIIFMPETHRKIVDDGSIVPYQWWRQSVLQYMSNRRRLKRMSAEERHDYEKTQQALAERQRDTRIRFPNPLGSFIILTNPDAFCLILYTGVMMFSNLVLMTSTPTVFPRLYGLNELEVGLCFLPLGIAASIGSFCNGRLLDWNYRRTARRLGVTVDRKRGDDLRNFPIERARLQGVFFSQAVQVAAILPYGWALERHASLAVPLILQFILGLCLVVASNSISTLLSDIYPGNVSTASAASNLVRCILGAVGAAVVDNMLTSLGLGWCFFLVGMLMAAATVLLWVEFTWGMGWRQQRWRSMEEKKKRKQAEEAEKNNSRP
ncbi:uncharacterized protein Z520_08290 [Fonsecaea multimorphosa CBS 102226]|uniref:Major facilitator superfamily (MFS) profile domain-containing protein n=1 Tax=Fonsecaea multimorphosa CBS 102226 TaxID=1442371 RepID=A0A0D2H2E9_9EURO|nr:uncharacterized protein Z520_08290 [Fonsecaea multimorphosa CBS 102226]KIX96035.1 hypothetical protein Z520_08290 [Fonsecaea multimorphosa CBS 102226]OAL21803.1 hypothetical protein AYO22_07745 [Fonsecaea multimorphosa]